MKIIIAGELPLIRELGELCLSGGHETELFLVEDFFSAIQSGSFMALDEDVDVVIELHNESAAAKEELLFGLGEGLSEEALLLTSTLAMSTTQAASLVPHPERVIGFGLLPPVNLDGLVEVARALQTTQPHFDRAVQFWKGLGLEVVEVADGPGLVRARVVCCLINEAVSALMEGVASAEDIDRAMKLGTNYPFGPLEWADYIGLDTVLGVMTGLFTEWGDDRYRPAPLLRRMVAAGYLGKKTGRGFYEYDSE